MCSFAHDLLLYSTSEMAHPFCHKSDILLMKENMDDYRLAPT